MNSTTERFTSSDDPRRWAGNLEEDRVTIKAPGMMEIEELETRKEQLKDQLDDMYEPVQYAWRLAAMYTDLRAQHARVENTLRERKKGINGYGLKEGVKGNDVSLPDGRDSSVGDKGTPVPHDPPKGVVV
jgi:hypothetical protein